MEITELPTVTLGELLRPAGTVVESTRSPGLHLSQIIQSLMQSLDPKKYAGEMDWNRIEAGVTFERLMERELIARNPLLIRPGEFSRDGIACSPDGLDRLDGSIEEYKFTWKSSRHHLTDDRFWAWLVQIKAYCYVVGTVKARLRVFFVNGDYAGYTPRLKCWTLTFTPEELSDNWQMILNHAKDKGML